MYTASFVLCGFKKRLKSAVETNGRHNKEDERRYQDKQCERLLFSFGRICSLVATTSHLPASDSLISLQIFHFPPPFRAAACLFRPQHPFTDIFHSTSLQMLKHLHCLFIFTPQKNIKILAPSTVIFAQTTSQSHVRHYHFHSL